ncbi:MAG: hypothetical protein H6739_14365 [Alphaproteobacteria bacterium]|nr:hypothetical protein [Alphaproteobacteria bacterium]
MQAPTPGQHRLVVRSIGSAAPAIQRAIVQALRLPKDDVLRRLYQAPSVLLDGIAEPLGEQLSGVLSEAGLETEVLPMDAPFTPGVGDREVALHVGDPARLREVVAVVARFLGSDAAGAAQVLRSAPAVLVGQVSIATVEALRAQLAPLGVELDVSVGGQSRYDLFLGPCEPGVRSLAARVLRALGVEAQPEGPLLALNLDRATADRVWAQLQPRAPVRLIDQAFQRFAIRLEEAPDTPEVRALLVAQTGMPAAVAPRVLSRLPIVLHQGARHTDVPALLSALAEVGARATAQLLTFLTFDLVVEQVTDRARAVDVVAAMTGHDAATVSQSLRALPARLEGPFNQTWALWMQAELRAAGVRASLEER